MRRVHPVGAAVNDTVYAAKRVRLRSMATGITHRRRVPGKLKVLHVYRLALMQCTGEMDRESVVVLPDDGPVDCIVCLLRGYDETPFTGGAAP